VIHFIHSYLNDAHERRAREIAAAEWPNAYITVGAELLPEYREFERGTTAAINAFVQPVIDRYLRKLAADLSGRDTGTSSSSCRAMAAPCRSTSRRATP
jgi:N-methylhydantoinase A